MAKKENLKERMDTIKANSVTDQEFEDAWGISVDALVKKMKARWDELLAQTKPDIDNENQPADERQQPAAQEEAVSAEEKEDKNNINGNCKLYVICISTKCPITTIDEKASKADWAEVAKNLYVTLKKQFENYEFEMSHQEPKKAESMSNTMLMMMHFDCIGCEEEREQVADAITHIVPYGCRICPAEAIDIDRYDIIHLCIRHKVRCSNK